MFIANKIILRGEASPMSTAIFISRLEGQLGNADKTSEAVSQGEADYIRLNKISFSPVSSCCLIFSDVSGINAFKSLAIS